MGGIFTCKNLLPVYTLPAIRAGSGLLPSGTRAHRAHHKESRRNPFGIFACLHTQWYYILLAGNDNAGTNGPSAFTDSKAQTVFDGYGCDKLNIHFNVVTRHAHLNAFRECDNTRYVGCAEIELRSVVVEEGCMTSAFLMLKNVNLSSELCKGFDGAGLCKNLAALYFVFAIPRRRQPTLSPASA